MSTDSVNPETVFNFGKHKGQTFIYVYQNDTNYVNWVKSIPDPKGMMLDFKNFVNEHEMCKNSNTNLKNTVCKQATLDRHLMDNNYNDLDILTPRTITVESNLLVKSDNTSPQRFDFLNKRKKILHKSTPGDVTFPKNPEKETKVEVNSPSLRYMWEQMQLAEDLVKEEPLIENEGMLALVLYSENEFYLSYSKSKDNSGWWNFYIPKELFNIISNMGLRPNDRMLGKQKCLTYNASDYGTVLKSLRAGVKDKSGIEPVPNFVLRTFPEFIQYSREVDIKNKTREILQGFQDDYTKANIDKMSTLIGDTMWTKLLPFQREGVIFGIKKNGRVLIGDDMGLGKTIQALAISAFYKEDWPLLIICPSSIKFQWAEQCLTWLPHLLEEEDVLLVKDSKSIPSEDFNGNYNIDWSSDYNQSLEENYDDDSTPETPSRLFKESKPKTNAKNKDFDAYDRPFKVVIISYDLMAKLKNLNGFKTVICDESHYLKNRNSQRSKRIVPMLKEAKRVILLSGTPAVNNPSELFEQLSSLIPGFSSHGVFVERYCKRKFNYFTKKPYYADSKHPHELHLFLVKTVMIRRLKDEVMKELPDKIRTKIPIEISQKVVVLTKLFFEKNPESFNSIINSAKASSDAVKPDSEGQSVIDDFLVKKPDGKEGSGRPSKDEVGGLDLGFDLTDKYGISDKNWLTGSEDNPEISGFMRMHQLFTMTGQDKIKGVCKYIVDFLECQHKFIIFAHHIFMLDAIEDTLKKQKVRYIRIDGSTNVNDRGRLVQEFQRTTDSRDSDDYDVRNAGKNDCESDKGDVRVALLSLTACGTGLNLTASSTVIFAELFWSPSSLLQAENRVHRIGTKATTVNIHYLIAQNSIDDVIWKVINNKQMAVTATLDGTMSNIVISGSSKKK